MSEVPQLECSHCWRPILGEDEESYCPFCNEPLHDDCNMAHQDGCNES